MSEVNALRPMQHSVRGLAAAVALLAFSNCAAFGQELPGWVADVRSSKSRCTEAAAEAKARAIAMGVAPERMQWLYGRKPFSETGHVSLVIDGWIVVDNGGLGRNVWGDPICIGDICSIKEARRGYDESFLEPATFALRHEIIK